MNPAQHLLVVAVLVYRLVVSPVLVVCFPATAGCRFEPTCSGYALEAVRTHGALRGAWLAAKRLARCHPWGGCGHDPVPAEVRNVECPSAAGRNPDSALRIPNSAFHE